MLSVYDEMVPAEKIALIDLLENVPHTQDRVSQLVNVPHASDHIVVLTERAEFMVKKIEVGNIHATQVNIETSFNHSSNIVNAMPATALKDQFEILMGLCRQLAARLPDPADQERIANYTDAFIKASSAAKPDKSMLRITAEGLKEAAQTVAEIAAPIATAVGAVLRIIGVTL